MANIKITEIGIMKIITISDPTDYENLLSFIVSGHHPVMFNKNGSEDEKRGEQTFQDFLAALSENTKIPLDSIKAALDTPENLR